MATCGDPVWGRTSHGLGGSEECPCRSHIMILTQHDVDKCAVAIDRTESPPQSTWNVPDLLHGADFDTTVRGIIKARKTRLDTTAAISLFSNPKSEHLYERYIDGDNSEPLKRS